MPFTDYKMGFREPVSMSRWHEYRAGLLDPWEAAVLFQDLIEAQCVPVGFVPHATYYVEMGMAHINERALQ